MSFDQIDALEKGMRSRAVGIKGAKLSDKAYSRQKNNVEEIRMTKVFSMQNAH